MNNFTILFVLVFFVGFFDPQNELGIRLILISLSLLLWIYGLKPALTDPQKNYVSLTFCYLMPIWGLIVYVIRGDGTFEITDTSYISFALIFSIINFLGTEKRQESFKKASILVGLAFSVFLMYVGYELVVSNTSTAIDFVLNNEIARVSFREYAGISIPYVYFFASTLLIIPLSVLYFEIQSNKGNNFSNVLFLLILFAFFLSGTRSHIAIGFLLFIGYVYKKGGVVRSICLVAIVCVVMVYGDISSVIMSMFSSQEDNNALKISMLSLYAEIFNDPLTIFIGQGYQGVSWSSELQKMVQETATKTELTFLELFRVYGAILPSFILVMFGRLFLKKMRDEYKYKKMILLLLILDSALNPHLFSTYGALALAISMSPNIKLSYRTNGTSILNSKNDKFVERVAI